MDNIAIYGAGNTGRKLHAALKKTGVEPLCFFDTAKHGSISDGVHVYSMEKAPSEVISQISIIILGVFNYKRESHLPIVVSYILEFGNFEVISFEEFYQNNSELFEENFYWLAPAKYFESKKEDIEKARGLFSDDKSIRIYDALISHRMGDNYSVLPEPDWDDEQYLPKDVPLCNQPYSFIDIGAFNGDTLAVFKKNGIKLNKLIAYEPDQQNFKALVERVKNEGPFADETYLIPAGVGETCGSFSFCSSGDMSSVFGDSGEEKIPVVPLDVTLNGINPTYVKMDIEGAEISALLGMKNIIQNDNPMLAVCVYHRPDDLFSIPLLLSKINPNQKFYLRMHGAHCFDTVLYVIPMKAPHWGIVERAKKIKVIITDIDGVLTDGKFGYSESGEVKFFNTQDGHAFILAKKLGYIIGAISGRSAVANQRRAKELKFDFLFENISTKLEAFNEVLDKYKVSAEECLFIGDDIQDICFVQKAGIGVLTANAPENLHIYADIVTKKSGGYGAVREVVDWLIDMTGKRNEILKLYDIKENIS